MTFEAFSIYIILISCLNLGQKFDLYHLKLEEELDSPTERN